MVDPFRQKGETLEAYRKRASEVLPPSSEAAWMASRTMSDFKKGTRTFKSLCVQGKKTLDLVITHSLL